MFNIHTSVMYMFDNTVKHVLKDHARSYQKVRHVTVSSTKLRSANLPVFVFGCDRVGDLTPASSAMSRRSNH